MPYGGVGSAPSQSSSRCDANAATSASTIGSDRDPTRIGTVSDSVPGLYRSDRCDPPCHGDRDNQSRRRRRRRCGSPFDAICGQQIEVGRRGQTAQTSDAGADRRRRVGSDPGGTARPPRRRAAWPIGLGIDAPMMADSAIVAAAEAKVGCLRKQADNQCLHRRVHIIALDFRPAHL